MFGAMIAALVVLGFYPQPVITTARQAVDGGAGADGRERAGPG